ncbi:MAG: thiaminase II [Rhodospirillales bacterium]
MTDQPLFERLRSACADDWRAYVEHPFVEGIQSGTLPEAAFRHYLVQDYLFLIHFARAYALAAYKAETLDDLRTAAEAVRVITEVEMGLHVEYCKGWGISEDEMRAAPEAERNMAYTRFVLERGHAGDLLDLLVALLPCAWGYAEIGLRLAGDPSTRRDGNPYLPWIEMYSSDDYVDGARACLAQLDRVYAERAGEGRIPSLIRTFSQAARLEAGFWQMGLDAT